MRVHACLSVYICVCPAHLSAHSTPFPHPQIALSTAAMVIHGLLHAGLLDWLAPALPAQALGAAKPWVEGALVPALLAYNVTVNFANVLRQSCLVVRACTWRACLLACLCAASRASWYVRIFVAACALIVCRTDGSTDLLVVVANTIITSSS